MSKVTVESLVVQIDRLYQIKDEQGQLSLDGEYRLEAYKMLLGVLIQEPVAYIFKHPVGRLFWTLTDESNKGQNDVMSVYASPQPAPVVPEDVRHAQPAAVSVPDGWKLVPEIPDSQMITAWKDANYNNASLESALRKMLNAAPEPPQAMHVLDEDQSRELFEKWCSVNIERNKWHPEFYAHLPAREQWAAWNACHAAMLNQR